MTEFIPWPKTARLFREAAVTEKIDGTNAAIRFTLTDAGTVSVVTQSRKRIIKPGDDNFGFAAWAHKHADELYALLGEGLHFGEWWGKGIQRGYGLDVRRFSLFNTDRFKAVNDFAGDVLVQPVPVLWRGTFDTAKVAECLADLRDNGSEAAPGFMDPEGVCVYHYATRTVLKATLDNNDAGKWEA